MIAFQTAYLKAHFPVELMAAILTSEMNSTEEVVKYIAECLEMSESQYRNLENGKTRLSYDTAILIALFFDTEPDILFLNDI